MIILAGKIKEYVLRIYSYSSQIALLTAPNRNENRLCDKMYGFVVKSKLERNRKGESNMKSDRKQTFSKFRQKSTKKQLAQTKKEMVKLRMETVKTNSG